MATKFEKYGVVWPFNNPVLIEIACILKGGIWKVEDKLVGKGMAFHKYALSRLLWPEDKEHRWEKLAIKTLAEHRFVTFLGSANSGKTHSMAKDILMDYWCRPKNSLSLLTTVSSLGNELKIWGRVKDLFNRAKKLWPNELAGNVIDSKMTITTDQVDKQGQKAARVLSRGIVCINCPAGSRESGIANYVGTKQEYLTLAGDECFPAGTLVDTPTGPVPIESIKPGDFVLNALAASRVTRTGSRLSRKLVRVKMMDGRTITCTPEHPFFTSQGWIKAIDLNRQQFMVTANEALQILLHPNQEQILLQHCLRSEMENDNPGRQGGLLRWRGAFGENLSSNVSSPQAKARDGSSAEKAPVREQLHEQSRHTPESVQHVKENGMEASCEDGERFRPNRSGEGPDGNLQEILPCIGVSSLYQNEGASDLLSNRRGHSFHENCHRGGWSISQQPGPKGIGPSEDHLLGGSWVDSVEVLQPDDPVFSEDRGIGIEVFNLSVAGHPSYSVNGFLVHNCQFIGSSIIDAVPNLAGNPRFKARFAGNPTDPLDPLGRAAEPKEGWTAMPVPTKTAIWTSKFCEAQVVNFVGTDSPNFDFPETEPTPFDFLSSREHHKLVGESWGYDSPKYRQQCLGVMWTGSLIWRVLTRDMAIQHHAKDAVIWKNETRRKIGSLDAAFSGIGGDRCVWAIHEFGEDINGKWIFLCGEPVIFKIGVRPEKTAEDQIAEQVKERADAANLPASDIFYDSSMRGTLGYAFARVFGAVVPVPIEFGGKPTTRPVRHDLYVTDPQTHQPRHKRCDEHYSKFVTELWFSARYIIECDQMRGLMEDVLTEGCLRQYSEVAGNKVEIESKTDKKAKERMGRSPDLFDNLVCGIEGARQRGFRIERLGALLIDTPNGLPKWLIEAESFARKHRESRRLIRA